MSHESYLMWISLDLDGKLSQQQRAELRLHLRGCAACAVAWDHMNLIDRALASQPEARPRIDFTARVMTRVETYESRRRWYPLFLVILSGILLAALVSVILPPAIVLLGLYKPFLDLPVVSTIVDYASQFAAIVGALGDLAWRDLGRWLTRLTTDPVTLGVVITALSTAAIWIGMREAMKYMPEAEAARQAA